LQNYLLTKLNLLVQSTAYNIVEDIVRMSHRNSVHADYPISLDPISVIHTKLFQRFNVYC